MGHQVWMCGKYGLALENNGMLDKCKNQVYSWIEIVLFINDYKHILLTAIGTADTTGSMSMTAIKTIVLSIVCSRFVPAFLIAISIQGILQSCTGNFEQCYLLHLPYQ